MTINGKLLWICTMTALANAMGQNETSLVDFQTTACRKIAAVTGECASSQTWNPQKIARILLLTRNVSEMLHQQQLNECSGAEPSQCPEAEVPPNGGLACTTVDNRRVCKSLCNQGYDFNFLKRSRPYDECSRETNYRWNSYYIGGNKLAVCIEAAVQVGGTETMYFDRDCLTTKSSVELQNKVFADLAKDLKGKISGDLESKCLVCG